MLIQAYSLSELKFAYCHRVYFRWRTHRRQRQRVLEQVDPGLVNRLVAHYDLHVLEASGSDTQILLLASLKPNESPSTAASKIKGQLSKWLRGQLELTNPSNLFSRGYFACTAGQSTGDAVQRYLSEQEVHHGYSDRAKPPVFVREYALSPADEARLNAKHSSCLLQYHMVLATYCRQGVFSQPAAEAVAGRWHAEQAEMKSALLKVSFVPDHVHLAIRTHPSVSPAGIVVRLMNLAQDVIWESFDANVIRAKIDRLWQPSAYIGSYGSLASPMIRKYIENWGAHQ